MRLPACRLFLFLVCLALVRYDPSPPHFNGAPVLTQDSTTRFAGQSDHLLLSCPVCADNVSDVSLGTAVVSRFEAGQFDSVWCDRTLGNAWSNTTMLMSCSKALQDNSSYVATCLCWNGVDMGIETTTQTAVLTDFTPPVCTLVGSVNTSFTPTSTPSSTTFNVSWACADADSGIVKLQWSVGYVNGSADVLSGVVTGAVNGSTPSIRQSLLSAMGASSASVWAPRVQHACMH